MLPVLQLYVAELHKLQISVNFNEKSSMVLDDAGSAIMTIAEITTEKCE